MIVTNMPQAAEFIPNARFRERALELGGLEISVKSLLRLRTHVLRFVAIPHMSATESAR